MQEAFVDINGVPTHVMAWGKWIEESLDECKEVVICITGNPGLPGFYSKFSSDLHNNLQLELNSSCPIPVWVLGHAGHDEPKSSSIRKIPVLQGNENLYNLNGQVQHKKEFIKKYVPNDVKIHLIGHSIGAWIILELLKDDEIVKRIQKTYMLFPTIERMKISRNGLLITYLLFPSLFLLAYILTIFNYLPTKLKIWMIFLYFWLFSIPNYFIGTTLKYLNWSIIDKVTFLAKDEMDKVKELDCDLIKKHVNLIKLYYSRSDGWVPVKYVEEIKQKIPNIDATLDNKNIEHAFVLRSSTEMANLVSNWIIQNSVVNFKKNDLLN